MVNGLYRRRRDTTLAALETHMPAGVTWTRPQGGMYLWVTLPPAIDGQDFARRALAEARVAVVPGRNFYPANPQPNTIRLAFPQTHEDRAGEGIARLAGLLRRMAGN